MRNNSLQQFVRIRKELNDERERLQLRLAQINEAMGEMPLPSLSPVQGATAPASSQSSGRDRRGSGGGRSLREHVLAALQGGAMTKEEVLSVVLNRGYKFSTDNPLNSLGVILYGKNPKFSRADGKFSLDGVHSKAPASGRATLGQKRRGRRKMSPEARERIAAAQRARWSKQRGK